MSREDWNARDAAVADGLDDLPWVFAPNQWALAGEDNCPYAAEVRFEWDRRKADANLRTHEVSFAEAATVLEDDFALSVRIQTPSTSPDS